MGHWAEPKCIDAYDGSVCPHDRGVLLLEVLTQQRLNPCCWEILCTVQSLLQAEQVGWRADRRAVEEALNKPFTLLCSHLDFGMSEVLHANPRDSDPHPCNDARQDDQSRVVAHNR